MLVDTDRKELDQRIHERRGERLARRRTALGSGRDGWLIASNRGLLIEDCARMPAEIRRACNDADSCLGTLLAVPLVHEGVPLGLICVQHSQPGIYSPADLNLLGWLAEQAGVALAEARAFEQLDEYRLHLEERVSERTAELADADRQRESLLVDLRAKSADLERLSREDPLTGLANRRDFGQRLAIEIARAARSGEPLAVALMDFDNFKRINDGCGHAIGDLVLREFAGLLRQQCRTLDVLARYGGEEFAVVLPNADLAAATQVCERIRLEVADFPWHTLHPKLRVTVSAGIAIWHPGTNADTLLALADSRLYAAKNAGRNRVVV